MITPTPHLWNAFQLEKRSDINFDPIVIAACCFFRDAAVTSIEAFQNGHLWFPQRSIKNAKGEAARFKRFAEAYPHIFLYESPSDTIALNGDALTVAEPDDKDLWLYQIALTRAGIKVPVTVSKEVVDQPTALRVGESTTSRETSQPPAYDDGHDEASDMVAEPASLTGTDQCFFVYRTLWCPMRKRKQKAKVRSEFRKW